MSPLSQVINIRPMLGSDLSKSSISISGLFIVCCRSTYAKHYTNKQLLIMCHA